jgi:hypothetical protein
MESTNAGAALPQQAATTPADAAKRRAGRLKMLALLLVCAAPVIASYFTYYVIRPEGRTNYGTLIEPMRDAGALGGGGVAALRGRWIMLTVAPAACDEACRERLYEVRQVRLTTGKDRDRIERVWLLEDAAEPDPALLAQHEGLVLLRADADALARLPVAPGARASDHIYVIDPLGNLMMRFPKDADPNRMKRDLAKLLRASRVG